MTAVTADRRYIKEGMGVKVQYPMKATDGVVYEGALVQIDSSGNATNGTDSASVRIVGIAVAGCSNTGAAGAKVCEVWQECTVGLAIEGSTLNYTDIGKTVVIKDNVTVTDAGEGTNDIPVGKLQRIEGGVAFVYIASAGFSAS